MTSQPVRELANRRTEGSSFFLLRLLPLRRLYHHHAGLCLALVIYLFLAFSYFFIMPIFEGPDEWTHTGHIKYIAEGNGLPVMLPGRGIFGGQQPPLYYGLGALLVQPFELDTFDEYLKDKQNPHASLGYALDPGNKNNFLHTPDENFPYRGLSLTVHILRLYSMIFGLVMLVFTYLTAFEILDFACVPLAGFSILDFSSPHPKFFATAVALFVACQPMFAFITAAVANEPANMAFCAIGLWLAQRYVLQGPSPHWGRAVALGVVIGLISLSKMTGLSFGLVAVVAMLLAALATRRQPGAAYLLWRDGVIIGLLALVIGGWWYWRNYQLYGDFFQQGLYKLYFNIDPQPLTLSKFLYILSTGEVSFWATFGWLNVVAPEWVYRAYWIVSRIGLLGVALWAIIQVIQWGLSNRLEGWKVGRLGDREIGGLGRSLADEAASQRINEGQVIHHASEPKAPYGRITYQSRRPPRAEGPLWVGVSLLCPLLLHFVFPVALAFSLTRLVATEGGMQGRQLLPALGSMAILIIWGWWVLTPSRIRLPVLMLLLGLLFSLAVWLPYGVVRPAYFPEPLLAEADLPADLPRLDLTYRGEMKLIGVEIEADKVRPGERAPVRVYWQALKPMTTNYSVFVHLIGREYRTVGQLNSYPGLGLRPTRSLQPGQIVVDSYPVLVEGGSAAPTRLLVNIGLFDFNEPGRPGIPPIAPDGNPALPTVGQLKLVPAVWPPVRTTPPIAEFADQIWLMAYSLQNCQTQQPDCEIQFEWLAQGRPGADYTVFIQLWRTDPREKATGFDAPPLGNDYPTSLWEAGEVILDSHRLDLTTVPPGTYQLLAGLYNLVTGDRLPATAAGTPLPDYAVDLGTIQIGAAAE